MKIYVGNLSFNSSERELQDLFAEHGEVVSASIITDRETGQSRGFGFVEMPDDQSARTAMEAVNGASLDGRNLTVNEARPRTNDGGGGRGRDGGGRGRGGW